jgi:signal transduction histidine kinase
MRQRADLIGATLSISSQPRDGSRVEVVLPLLGEERPGGG